VRPFSRNVTVGGKKRARGLGAGACHACVEHFTVKHP